MPDRSAGSRESSSSSDSDSDSGKPRPAGRGRAMSNGEGLLVAHPAMRPVAGKKPLKPAVQVGVPGVQVDLGTENTPSVLKRAEGPTSSTKRPQQDLGEVTKVGAKAVAETVIAAPMTAVELAADGAEMTLKAAAAPLELAAGLGNPVLFREMNDDDVYSLVHDYDPETQKRVDEAVARMQNNKTNARNFLKSLKGAEIKGEIVKVAAALYVIGDRNDETVKEFAEVAVPVLEEEMYKDDFGWQTASSSWRGEHELSDVVDPQRLEIAQLRVKSWGVDFDTTKNRHEHMKANQRIKAAENHPHSLETVIAHIMHDDGDSKKDDPLAELYVLLKHNKVYCSDPRVQNLVLKIIDQMPDYDCGCKLLPSSDEPLGVVGMIARAMGRRTG